MGGVEEKMCGRNHRLNRSQIPVQANQCFIMKIVSLLVLDVDVV